jgi:hypothetical protein
LAVLTARMYGAQGQFMVGLVRASARSTLRNRSSGRCARREPLIVSQLRPARTGWPGIRTGTSRPRDLPPSVRPRAWSMATTSQLASAWPGPPARSCAGRCSAQCSRTLGTRPDRAAAARPLGSDA